MTVISTKQGDVDLDGESEPKGQPFASNRVTGEVTFRDREGREYRLRPTFEALLEIEDKTGIGIDALWISFASSGLGGMAVAAPTTRQYGVVLMAGVKAAGEHRITVDRANRMVFEIGRTILRPALTEFLWSIRDGGRGRADDLGKEDSSSASGVADPVVNDLIRDLESRSGNSSESPSES